MIISLYAVIGERLYKSLTIAEGDSVYIVPVITDRGATQSDMDSTVELDMLSATTLDATVEGVMKLGTPTLLVTMKDSVEEVSEDIVLNVKNWSGGTFTKGEDLVITVRDSLEPFSFDINEPRLALMSFIDNKWMEISVLSLLGSGTLTLKFLLVNLQNQLLDATGLTVSYTAINYDSSFASTILSSATPGVVQVGAQFNVAIPARNAATTQNMLRVKGTMSEAVAGGMFPLTTQSDYIVCGANGSAYPDLYSSLFPLVVVGGDYFKSYAVSEGGNCNITFFLIEKDRFNRINQAFNHVVVTQSGITSDDYSFGVGNSKLSGNNYILSTNVGTSNDIEIDTLTLSANGLFYTVGTTNYSTLNVTQGRLNLTIFDLAPTATSMRLIPGVEVGGVFRRDQVVGVEGTTLNITVRAYDRRMNRLMGIPGTVTVKAYPASSTNGIDYSFTTGTIAIDGTISLSLLSDAQVEPMEDLIIEIQSYSQSGSYNYIEYSNLVVIIRDSTPVRASVVVTEWGSSVTTSRLTEGKSYSLKVALLDPANNTVASSGAVTSSVSSNMTAEDYSGIPSTLFFNQAYSFTVYKDNIAENDYLRMTFSLASNPEGYNIQDLPLTVSMDVTDFTDVSYQVTSYQGPSYGSSQQYGGTSTVVGATAGSQINNASSPYYNIDNNVNLLKDGSEFLFRPPPVGPTVGCMFYANSTFAQFGFGKFRSDRRYMFNKPGSNIGFISGTTLKMNMVMTYGPTQVFYYIPRLDIVSYDNQSLYGSNFTIRDGIQIKMEVGV